MLENMLPLFLLQTVAITACKLMQLQLSRNTLYKFLLHKRPFQTTVNVAITVTEGMRLGFSDWTLRKT